MTNSRPSGIPQSSPLSSSAESNSETDFDFIVIGSGFTGSLIACILQGQGRRVAIVDRSSHPRFAIGESSTPAASLILSSLADQYDLQWLKPFAKYGTWKQRYPQITTGRKRGFSYFQHEAGQDFQPKLNHSSELLAAASSSDEQSDMQWLRSDVDEFFFEKACESGVASFQNSEITALRQRQSGWVVEVSETPRRKVSRHQVLSAGFLIDASGTGQVLAKHLDITDNSEALATNSRAIFAHVTGLPEWKSILEQTSSGSTTDHPFHCDNAALHHVLEEGWMWWLRFDSGVTSVGLVLDDREGTRSRSTKVASGSSSTDETDFIQTINRYPSLQCVFATAELTDPAAMPLHTRRLQRLAGEVAGTNWAMLPHTAGFIDPLHSTGIAHSLAGVERLVGILLAQHDDSSRTQSLQRYGSSVREELTLIDQLVAGCYDAIAQRSFRKFSAFTMCYFAAATTWERRRIAGTDRHRPALLCSDVPEFRAAVTNIRRQLPSETDESFEQLCRKTLTPFNHVGLFEPPIPNMYGATALPE